MTSYTIDGEAADEQHSGAAVAALPDPDLSYPRTPTHDERSSRGFDT